MKNSNVNQNTPLSFKNYLIFVGIDVHEKSWKVTIRLDGREMKTFSCSSEAEELHNYLTKNYPGGTYLSVYEAGFCGFSIHRQLMELGIKNIIVNPSDIPTTDKDKKAKSDTRDSRKLASSLEKGDLKAIYVPSQADESFRTLYRLKEQFNKEKRRTMTRIRSFFFTKDVSFPRTVWSKKGIQSIRDMIKGKADEYAVTELIDTLEFFKGKIERVRTEINRQIKLRKKEKEREMIETVPGVGNVTSEALLAELIDPGRFKNDNDLCSYVGLIPNTNSSGPNERSRGLTKRRNGRLRFVIIEAAWIASKKDPELSLAYANYCKRMKPSDAIIRIAKKLTIRIKRVWERMEPYQLNHNINNTEVAG